MSSPVLAYLDPGTGSMLLQVIVGGLAAVGVGGRYMWRRITGKQPAPSKTQTEAPPETESATPVE